MIYLTSGHASLLLVAPLLLLLFVPGGLTDHRRTRETKFSGISSGIHRSSQLQSGDDLHIDAVSTSSVTTSTSQVEEEPVTQVLSIHVPGQVIHSHDAGIASSESIIGTLSSTTVSKPPGLFVRPEGPLPILTEHFGFDHPPPLHPGSLPNCGCLPRGGCSGKVAAYTRLVLPYTDVVCGLTFQTCCFDGPWAGHYDSFSEAAACVPKEQCARPYGVLPTDVRDFGVIAPCPGQGAVRCLAVSEEELLVFQAAVAAIDAANAYNAHNAYHIVEPMHFLVPLGTSGGKTGATTIQATSTSSVTTSQSNEELEEIEVESLPPTPSVAPPPPVAVPLVPARPVVPAVSIPSVPVTPVFPPISIPPVPATPVVPPTSIHPGPPTPVLPPTSIPPVPATPWVPPTSIPPVPAAPVVPPTSIPPAAVTPLVPPTSIPPVLVTNVVPPTIIHVAPPPPVIIPTVPVLHVVPPVSIPPVPAAPVVPPVVIPPVPAAHVVPPVVIPPAAIPGYPGPGGYYGATGYPWGGFGFRKGFSIRKRISFNKGGFIIG